MAEHLTRNEKVVGSIPTSSSKKKDTLIACLSFWASRAEGPLRPSVIQMLGMAEPSLRRGFASGKTLVRRKSGAAQKGRWAIFQDGESKI